MGSVKGTPAGKGERRYIAVLEGGTEISKEGPFPTAEARDKRAFEVWNQECDQETDNVFGVDVDLDNPDDPLSVWNYSNGFMEDGPDGEDEDEVEVPGGVMQWEPDSGVIRFTDDHGNTEAVWWPTDPDYEQIKMQHFPSRTVSPPTEEE